MAKTKKIKTEMTPHEFMTAMNEMLQNPEPTPRIDKVLRVLRSQGLSEREAHRALATMSDRKFEALLRVPEKYLSRIEALEARYPELRGLSNAQLEARVQP